MIMTSGEFAADAAPWRECVDHIVNAPGVDPVLVTIHGNDDELPATGYLVSASLTPGIPIGSMEIVRYSPGGFALGVPVVSETYGQASVGAQFGELSSDTLLVSSTSADCGGYNISGRSLYGEKATVQQLSSGQFLISRPQPSVFTGRSTSYRTLRTLNPYGLPEPPDRQVRMELERVTGTSKEATAVVEAIARGMGLQGNDLDELVVLAGQKIEALPEAGRASLPKATSGRLGALITNALFSER